MTARPAPRVRVTAPRTAVVGTLAALLCLPVGAATATDPTPLGSGPAYAPDRTAEPLGRVAASSSSAPQTRFQVPFPCGESWTGSTRDSHSPSRYSVDWNRTDDEHDPVVASAPGVVVRAEKWQTSYGHWVQLRHPSGETTLYAHMNAVTVALGQSVDQGQQVGTVGNTGNSYGAHLHYEQRTSSSSVRWPWFDGAAFTFGTTVASRNCVDVPLAGDFVRDARAEVAVFRRGTPGVFRIRRLDGTTKTVPFGGATDQPVVGDWNGDGRVEVGVRSPATRTFSLQTSSGVSKVVLGQPRDLPVAGDWDGDGTDEVGVRRATGNRFLLRAADGTTRTVALGEVGDLPVTGDWNGDGVSDLGVYDQASATFTLRLVDADGLAWTAEVPWGRAGDLPVTGDWDANGRTDLGTWNPATAEFSQRRAVSPTAARAQAAPLLRYGRKR